MIPILFERGFPTSLLFLLPITYSYYLYYVRIKKGSALSGPEALGRSVIALLWGCATFVYLAALVSFALFREDLFLSAYPYVLISGFMLAQAYAGYTLNNTTERCGPLCLVILCVSGVFLYSIIAMLALVEYDGRYLVTAFAVYIPMISAGFYLARRAPE